MMSEIELAAETGYRPGAVASIRDGDEIVLISYPYTDGDEICVLGLRNPNDPSSWKEFRIDELVLIDEKRTPAVLSELLVPASSKE